MTVRGRNDKCQSVLIQGLDDAEMLGPLGTRLAVFLPWQIVDPFLLAQVAPRRLAKGIDLAIGHFHMKQGIISQGDTRTVSKTAFEHVQADAKNAQIPDGRSGPLGDTRPFSFVGLTIALPL